MIRTILAASMLVAAVGCAGTQKTTATEAQNVIVGENGRIPRGTTLWVKLDTKLEMDKTMPGDQFTARVSKSLVASNGEVLIPRNARVSGHVTEVRRGHEDEPNAIFLAFDSLDMQGHRQPMSGHIVKTELPSATSRIKTGHVLGGAAVGAVLGGLVKGAGGAIVGGALGAATGTAISLGTSGHESLDRGTKLAVELDRPVLSLAAVEGRVVY